MHWKTLVYTVTAKYYVICSPSLYCTKLCLFTLGTWHIQHSNCISNILRDVHNSYNTCKRHNVQGKFCFALSLYIRFLFSFCHLSSYILWTLSKNFTLLHLFLMHACLVVYIKTNGTADYYKWTAIIDLFDGWRETVILYCISNCSKISLS
jgi:hypothetical protein